jgi:hypothetical protein
MSERRYWIGVVSQEDANKAVAEGFVQLGFGRAEPLERMQPGDGVTFYSPRTAPQTGTLVQAFTAIGRVGAGPIYEVPPVEPAHTFRRDAAWLAATPAAIKPLLPQLAFIRNKEHWGAAFRFGVVRVSRDDFAAIARAMGREPDADFA